MSIRWGSSRRLSTGSPGPDTRQHRSRRVARLRSLRVSGKPRARSRLQAHHGQERVARRAQAESKWSSGQDLLVARAWIIAEQPHDIAYANAIQYQCATNSDTSTAGRKPSLLANGAAVSARCRRRGRIRHRPRRPRELSTMRTRRSHTSASRRARPWRSRAPAANAPLRTIQYIRRSIAFLLEVARAATGPACRPREPRCRCLLEASRAMANAVARTVRCGYGRLRHASSLE